MIDLFSVKDKIILVTGAGKGIGEFLAHNLASHSAIVSGIDIKYIYILAEKIFNF